MLKVKDARTNMLIQCVRHISQYISSYQKILRIYQSIPNYYTDDEMKEISQMYYDIVNMYIQSTIFSTLFKENHYNEYSTIYKLLLPSMKFINTKDFLHLGNNLQKIRNLLNI